MEIDNITYEDLSLYSKEEEFSIFHKLDFTRTRGGKDLLLEYFSKPFSNLGPIQSTQQILGLMLEKLNLLRLSLRRKSSLPLASPSVASPRLRSESPL